MDKIEIPFEKWFKGDTWHHLAITQIDGEIEIFVDGARVWEGK